MQFSDDIVIKEELSQFEAIENTFFFNFNPTDKDIFERNNFKDPLSF